MIRKNRRALQPVRQSGAPVVMTESLESRVLFARIWYVNQSNTQPNRDGSPGNPFATIQSGVNNAAAGDKIYVTHGTYNEIVTFQDKNNVILQKDPADTATDGNGKPLSIYVTSSAVAQNRGLVEIRNSTNITVQNLTVQNSTWSAFEVYGGSNITIQNNRTLNNAASSFHTNDKVYGGSSNVSFLSNISSGDCKALANASTSVFTQEIVSMAGVNGFDIEFNNIGYSPVATKGHGAEGIDNKGSSHGKILHNTLHDFNEKAIYVGSYAADTTDVEVAYNTVYNCIQGINLNSEDGGTVSDYRIHDNLIYNNKDTGILISQFHQPDVSQSGPRNNISIVNNTVCNNGNTPSNPSVGAGGIYLEYPVSISGIRIYNNLVADNASWQINADSRLATSAIDAQRNLIRGNNTFSQHVAYGTPSAGPYFVNGNYASSPDFHLRSDAQARNFGFDSTYVSTTDIDYRSRLVNGVRDTTPDVGAYTYV